MKLLPKLACRYIAGRFDAYRKREISLRERRYIATHLATCADCKAKYADNNIASAALEYELSSFGRANRPQLARIWGAIQQDLQTPRRNPQPYARYGIVATFVGAFFAVSLLSGNGSSSALPIANTANQSEFVANPTPSAVASNFNYAELTSSLTPTAKQAVSLQNTPESTQDER